MYFRRGMKRAEVLYLIYSIVKLGGLKGARLTTTQLGKCLGISQQSASRKLIELERLGYIKREKYGNFIIIFVTEKGINLLRGLYLDLMKLFEQREILFILRGRVFTGFGEGRYYVSLPEYRRQFISKLGFDPYPGTLNLRLDQESVKLRKRLEVMEGIMIDGFFRENRRYGSVKCFKAIINDKAEGAVILIERTHYGPDVLEVISPLNLRTVLGLNDGDWVIVSVHVNS